MKQHLRLYSTETDLVGKLAQTFGMRVLCSSVVAPEVWVSLTTNEQKELTVLMELLVTQQHTVQDLQNILRVRAGIVLMTLQEMPSPSPSAVFFGVADLLFYSCYR